MNCDRTLEFVNFLSDVSLGLLAVWQGFVILSDAQLRRIAGLGTTVVQASIWYRLRKADGPILIVVIAGFALAIVLRIIQLV